MAEYDKVPYKVQSVKRKWGHSRSMYTTVFFFSFEKLWGGKKNKKVDEVNRIWVALTMDKENFSR